jgi:thymidylate kinase
VLVEPAGDAHPAVTDPGVSCDSIAASAEATDAALTVAAVSRDRAPAPAGSLLLVRELTSALAAAGVSYCHWKSNDALSRSESGDNDLDLLVDRADAGRFVEVLARLGFKQARPASRDQLPGIVDYYGFDRGSGRVLHVHAHYRLVVGDDMTKNYHLPLEPAFLAGTVQQRLLPTPAPEVEFIAFVIRMVLKYWTWEGALRLRCRLPRSARDELRYLSPRADRPRVDALLREHLPILDPVLFDRCATALAEPSSVLVRLRLSRQLHRALAGLARRPPVIDRCLKPVRRATRVLRWLVVRRSLRKRPATGGALVAIVGGDGAGKSTAIDELASWLRRHFATATGHLGKPHESVASLAFAAACEACRALGWLPAASTPGEIGRLRSPVVYLWLLRRVTLARRRYREWVRARRLASNGVIVLCDRYPLPSLSLMDGPQSHWLPVETRERPLARWLALREHAYYARILPPDVLAVLRVQPEIAVRRKPEESPAMVFARNDEIWNADWRGTRASVVDATRSAAEVLGELKSLVWGAI